MPTYNAHYRAYFSIRPERPPDGQDFWSILVKRVGEWLYDRYADVRCNRTGIIRTWLFLGGDWFSDLPDVTAEVRTFRADAPESDPPRYWVFRLQERDREFPERFWRTDIGITSVSNQRFDVSVVLSHYIIPGHFAKDPPEPEPAVSSVVDYLFDLEGSQVECAGQRLYSFAQPLLSGHAEGFVKSIADPDRRHLLVLVKPDENGRFHIDPESLAQILVGNANVYYYDNERVEMEMQRYLGEHYSTYYCARNAARIYQTGVNFRDPKDYGRHRFFLFRNYADAKDLEAVLFKGLQRRKEPPFFDFISFKEDISHKQKEQRLRELALVAKSASEQVQYIKLMEEEMQALQESNEKIDEALQQKEEEVRYGEGEIDELDHKLKRLIFENKQLGQLLQAHERQASLYQRTQQTIAHFAKLPTSLTEVLTAIAALQHQRLHFLDEALKSAEASDFADVHTAWNLLWHMATTLSDLHFEQKSDLKTIEQQFRAISGYELAFTESHHTKESSRMMAERTRTYMGQEIDILAHVKVNKSGRFLRVHYWADHTSQLIVIGHCGDHLETYGKRRRKD